MLRLTNPVQVFLLLLFLVQSAWTQLLPANSETILYFPHFVTGGNLNDYFRTDFDFVNSNDEMVILSLQGYDDTGRPMSIELNGSSAMPLIFYIPANGTLTLRTTRATQPLNGWVQVYADLPIQGIATFTRIRDGIPMAKVTAEPSKRTPLYRNLANRDVGIALANPSPNFVSVSVAAYSSGGSEQGTKIKVLPPFGHTAFNLGNEISGLPQNFSGSVFLAGSESSDRFVAWAVHDDGSRVNSALPAGAYARPVSHEELITKIYALVSRAAKSHLGLPAVNLSILGGADVNAYSVGTENIAMTLGLAEILGESPDEIAFVLGHELGHIYQARHGNSLTFDPNKERDADIWGTFFALGAGFDPYAMSGALAKLSMVTGTAGFLSQTQSYFDNLLIPEAHGSFNDRIANVFSTLQRGCSSSAEIQRLCNDYKRAFHPHLPGIAPLRRPNNDGFTWSGLVPGGAKSPE